MNFKILTKVTRVDERFQLTHVSGVGAQAEMKEISLGWFVQFEGSQEALYVGADKPAISPGDGYEITFRKVPDANP